MASRWGTDEHGTPSSNDTPDLSEGSNRSTLRDPTQTGVDPNTDARSPCCGIAAEHGAGRRTVANIELRLLRYAVVVRHAPDPTASTL